MTEVSKTFMEEIDQSIEIQKKVQEFLKELDSSDEDITNFTFFSSILMQLFGFMYAHEISDENLKYLIETAINSVKLQRKTND